MSLPPFRDRDGLRGLVISTLLTTGLVAIAIGISIPMMTTHHLAARSETYSVLSGIWSLHTRGEPGLALLIFGFSVVFPIGKLFLLGLIWQRRARHAVERGTLAVLKVLGKWSMVDFFVVVVLAGALQLGILASTTIREGLYVFGGAILLSMAVTALVAGFLSGPADPPPGRLPPAFGALLPVTALVFWRALNAPLMRLEKWYFWSTEYSILSGIRSLAAGDGPILAAALGLFVVVLPAAAVIGWAGLWVTSRLGRRHGFWTHVFLGIEEWAMVDVFALAAILVAAKISAVAGFEPREGLWLLGVTALLFGVASLWGRRSLRPDVSRAAAEAPPARRASG